MDREERIRRRAYELWVSEGRPDGRENEHWRQASEDIDNDDRASNEGSGSDASAGGLSTPLQQGGTVPGRDSPGADTGSPGTASGQPSRKKGSAKKRK